jgi:hypothetical protein
MYDRVAKVCNPLIFCICGNRTISFSTEHWSYHFAISTHFAS